MPGFLAKLESIHAALAEAKTLPDVKRIRDLAEAARQFASGAKLGLKMQNECAAIKIRAERKAGEMLAGMEKNKGAACRTRLHDATTLNELGIDKTQSHRWQRMAAVAEEQLSTLIESCNSDLKELTSAAVLRIAGLQRAIDPVELGDLEAECRRAEVFLFRVAGKLAEQDIEKFCTRIRILADRISNREFNDDL